MSRISKAMLKQMQKNGAQILSDLPHQPILAQSTSSSPATPASKRSKQGARRKKVDNINFDSTGEVDRYSFLKRMEEMGVISDLVTQPEFELQPAFQRHGRKFQNITYSADYAYTIKDEHGSCRWIEDKKPWGWNSKKKKYEIRILPESQRAIKGFLYHYPGRHFLINTLLDFLPASNQTTSETERVEIYRGEPNGKD